MYESFYWSIKSSNSECIPGLEKIYAKSVDESVASHSNNCHLFCFSLCFFFLFLTKEIMAEFNLNPKVQRDETVEINFRCKKSHTNSMNEILNKDSLANCRYMMSYISGIN